MGRGRARDGIDAIQCHMTNTMNTPIEAIEREYPLRVERYEIAEGTGGAGTHRGGNGLISALRIIDGSCDVRASCGPSHETASRRQWRRKRRPWPPHAAPQ